MVTEMSFAKKGLRMGGFALLAFLVALICVAQAAYPPVNDLSVSKVAQINGVVVQEVNPGQTFNYNVTVTNNGVNPAPEVVVTDKLPYDVVYVGAAITPATPLDYTINKSGDLVYVRFDEIPAGAARFINFTVVAPSETPSTLYNIVNVRYGNDPNAVNNRVTISTYVPQVGYDQTEAAKSFEDLLHNQSQLLFQFEDLLHTVPATDEENYTFLVSFEQLLRSQSDLTSSFEDLLSNSSSTGWDTEYTEENRTYLLKSYERMLWDEAFLFASFNMKIDDSWISLCNYTQPGHTQDAQTELTASFEDLLKRQTRPYKSFDLLLNKIDITSHQDMIDFLAAYENLLRIEANLFRSFNELLGMKYKGLGPCQPPTITVVRSQHSGTPTGRGGEEFEISVTNNDPINDMIISKLTGTGGIIPMPTGSVTYAMIDDAATKWDLVVDFATYNGTDLSLPIAPGETRDFYLNWLEITGSGFTIPIRLEYLFCVYTNFGSACETNVDDIASFSPMPLEHQSSDSDDGKTKEIQDINTTTNQAI